MIKDVSNALNFKKNDVVLDAGGGAGLISMCVSSFVKEVVLFDFSEKLIQAPSG
jgi:tRNA/tmRNA/rRNA uracil-C5-methylase (TrmA/RlmC/RlmD family)